MEPQITPTAFACAFSRMIEESQALDKMYSLIGFGPLCGEADMEASTMLEVFLLLRERGVDVQLRQRRCLIVEEDGPKQTGDAFYTLCYEGVDIDPMGRTELDAIAQAWFSHYYDGHAYGGLGEEGMITLPANPAQTRMREHLAPHVGAMVAQLQAQVLEDRAPARSNARARNRI